MEAKLELNAESRVKLKLIQALDVWCNMFMVIGTSSETPRYSQVIGNDDFTNWSLQSTVSGVYYNIEWDTDELAFIKSMQCSEKLWNWWKAIRTNHLKENYKTISYE